MRTQDSVRLQMGRFFHRVQGVQLYTESLYMRTFGELTDLKFEHVIFPDCKNAKTLFHNKARRQFFTI